MSRIPKSPKFGSLALREAKRRDRELSAGTREGVSHESAMNAARQMRLVQRDPAGEHEAAMSAARKMGL